MFIRIYLQNIDFFKSKSRKKRRQEHSQKEKKKQEKIYSNDRQSEKWIKLVIWLKLFLQITDILVLEKNKIKIEKQFEKEKQIERRRKKNIIINRTRITFWIPFFFSFLHMIFFYDATKIQEKMIGWVRRLET